ncbi:hypothetical protein PN497_00250, partial [Sphaerospermopsis kisseleviana CS-549]|nr:hypothetical protein [Sphaerospermopsis kisseleviana CS-549]
LFSCKGEAFGQQIINFMTRLFSRKGEAFGQQIINFMTRLFSCKGEAFGQQIINFMTRLFSECFAPTSPLLLLYLRFGLITHHPSPLLLR